MEDKNEIPKEQNEKEYNHHELIQILQKNTSNIRNICVLAHVDHGKTSLVDSLISYNNIISPKMAGNVRYMDSREDEQERHITMKASSITVIYRSEKLNSNYLLNIIDVPGHIDFSYEIFSSLKMVDGAIIMIDVIEGICSQTESAIRQAWDEKIKYILVLNKIDKLFRIVEMSPEQAYEHLKNLLEKVNAMMSSLILRDEEINNLLNLERKESNISNTW
jgi:ribosome assembly protein 1